MKKPDHITTAYIDFDGFFASVEEQARPSLRGKPIGVIPFAHATATCIIAANYKAKSMGIKSLMRVTEARRICPSIKLVPQSPDLYERAHRKLLLLIENELPIDSICSIDELSCKIDDRGRQDLVGLTERIKANLKEGIGPYITCSIGYSVNRQLAKIASDMDKPNGMTILHPGDLPGRLLDLQLSDIPGIGKSMRNRLYSAKIYDMKALWNVQPKQMRALWGNVTGERLWYALHGYEVQADPTKRSMYGHGRVLPPEWRDYDHAYDCARLLTIKAARRLRRGGYLANKFGLWFKMRDDSWSGEEYLPDINDDYNAISALTRLWKMAQAQLPKQPYLIQVHVALYGLTPVGSKQFDFFVKDDVVSQKWHKLSDTMDRINSRYAKSLITMGKWQQPPGGYAGGKIAFSRVPDMEDFW